MGLYILSSWLSLWFLKFTKEQRDKRIETMGLPLLYKTLDIIKYFQPDYYCIENPDRGSMKKYLTHLPSKVVSYCQYGYPYQKNTRLWTNIDFEPKKCCCAGVHREEIRKISNLARKYSIPTPLIIDIFAGVNSEKI